MLRPEGLRESSIRPFHKRNTEIFNKLVLIFVGMLLVFSKAVVEAVFTETPVLTTHRNWFGFSLQMVSLSYFTEILICKVCLKQ